MWTPDREINPSWDKEPKLYKCEDCNATGYINEFNDETEEEELIVCPTCKGECYLESEGNDD